MPAYACRGVYPKRPAFLAVTLQQMGVRWAPPSSVCKLDKIGKIAPVTPADVRHKASCDVKRFQARIV